MLKSNELLVVGASTFSNKKGTEFNAIDCVYVNSFNQYKVRTFFTSLEVVKQFSGSGIYTATFGPDANVLSITKVKGFDLP